MAPYLNEEAEARKEVLSNVMQYLADNVIVPNSGKPCLDIPHFLPSTSSTISASSLDFAFPK